MKYLDEDILLSLGNRQEGYHNYQIAIQDEVVYNGRFYVAPGETSIEADITDILANYRYIYRMPVDFTSKSTTIFGPEATTMVGGNNLVVNVKLKDLTQDDKYSIVSEEVAMIYRYPNANYTLPYDNYSLFVPGTDKMTVRTMLQGTDIYKSSNNLLLYSPKYLPHYPLKMTNNYGMILSFLFNKSKPEKLYFLLNNSKYDYDAIGILNIDITEYDGGSFDMFYSLSDWLLSYRDNPSEMEKNINCPIVYYANSAELISYYGIDTDYAFYKGATMTDKSKFIAAVQKFYGSEIASEVAKEIMSSSIDYGHLQIPVNDTNLFSLEENWEIFVDHDVPKRDDDPSQPIITFSNTENYVISSVFTSDNKAPIAKFDKCPSEYYLMWQDRMGGIQSQPLRNKSVYSESFNQTTITNYLNHTRQFNTEIQPEWELMTEWIDDEYYPIWESIFSSAYLLLYNTKLDKNYRVIATDKQFVQKTHKNQKNLFKLTIKLQLDKPQNIIS